MKYTFDIKQNYYYYYYITRWAYLLDYIFKGKVLRHENTDDHFSDLLFSVDSRSLIKVHGFEPCY